MRLRPFMMAAALAATLASCTTATSPLTDGPPAAIPGALTGIDEYVERAMRDWSVPGLAIAIVSEDRVVLSRGYGVREIGRPERVDDDTIFAIGSCTKAFTATALAMLVGEGKLEWDRPVVTHLPQFRLADPYVTRNATVRDLLTNRSGAPGIAAGEIPLYGATNTTEELLARIAELPGWSFRERFDYSNGMYVVAGELIPAVTGKPYEEFIRERLFTPLGMSRSTFRAETLKEQDNVAAAHALSDRGARAEPWMRVNHLGPAGGVGSSASDMAAWVRFQLAGGQVAGQRLVERNAIEVTRQPAVVIPQDRLWSTSFPAAEILTWGMGWTVSTYRGERVVEHVGIAGGMHAAVGLVPARDLGVVVLSNAAFPRNQLPAALRYWIYDCFLGAERKDWSRLLREQQTAQRPRR